MTDSFFMFGGLPEDPLRLIDHQMVAKGGRATITIKIETTDHYAAAHTMKSLDGVKKAQSEKGVRVKKPATRQAGGTE